MKLLPSKYNFWNIVYEFSTRLIKLFSWKLKKVEKKQLLSGEYNDSQMHSPIFIVGLPRSGTTFLYQIVTNRYKVSYFDNLFDIMYRFPLTGMYYSNFFYGDKPHNCFKSQAGGTLRYGLHCPSEATNYWYRFFEKNKYQVLPGELSKEAKKQLKLEIRTILSHYNRPLVIKNLANNLRLKLIKELFPEAKILIIERNEQDIFNSIMKVRRKKAIKPNEFWSIYPPEIESVNFQDEKDLVYNQIKALKSHIYQGIKIFSQKNVFFIHYEELLNSFNETKSNLDNFIDTNLLKNALSPHTRKKYVNVR